MTERMGDGKGPEGGCPEPNYPRQLRASSSEPRLVAFTDLTRSGEGLVYFVDGAIPPGMEVVLIGGQMSLVESVVQGDQTYRQRIDTVSPHEQRIR